MNDHHKPRKEPRGQGDLFNSPLAAARKARDDGMQVALDNAGHDFAASVVAMVRDYPSGQVCTGETIRFDAEERGISPPTPKAWGAVVRRLICSKTLTPTGRYVSPISRASHACKKPEYRRTSR